MELSKRLKFIANHIEKCKSIADIGTDHGYIPIYAVKNNLFFISFLRYASFGVKSHAESVSILIAIFSS